ncbi:DUF927 domain-containing protein [Mesorhizobium sp. M0579]|uniref:DUF927 domain-containing protein n=1 Tax=Mesorhizobium sp. M0579 TaxID=2956962 RepID=UPI00333D2847
MTEENKPQLITADGLSKAADQPAILDAVVDQHGSHRVKFGTATNNCWFSVSELQIDERSVFARLSNAGIQYLEARKKNAFKKEIQDHDGYRSGLVAAHPGWVGSHYVFGDGTVASPKDVPGEVIIAFSGDDKFTSAGTLKEWKTAIGKMITDQPLPLFVLCFALLAPILRFVRDMMNPQVELVGKPECGKTTLGVFASSVWAGDDDSEVGGGETWDMTINALDPLKIAHAGTLLFLDEANLAEEEVIIKAIYKTSSKGGRKRWTDREKLPNVGLALLSTSNDPLTNFVKASAVKKAGAQSRMATVTIDKNQPLGVLKFMPEGFKSSRAAMKHLRRVAHTSYGVAGRAFVHRLVESDPEEIQVEVDKQMARFLRRLRPQDGNGTSRAEQMFAAAFAAGILARKWGILPKRWGKLAPALLAVANCIDGSAASQGLHPSAMDRIKAYLKTVQADLIEYKRLKKPMDRQEFSNAAGVWRDLNGRRELTISTVRFQKEFPDHRDVMKELRASGAIKSENGKLSIKAPRYVCESGRVYVISLPHHAIAD